ncbi:hypothetical protein L4D09_22670 [Photobacterium makurazakiensis]|uniref:hypothetical protein n=1 Tax=Photobacterium makurazakiensis TaxID=2910234 RepID=UPI003D1208AF
MKKAPIAVPLIAVFGEAAEVMVTKSENVYSQVRQAIVEGLIISFHGVEFESPEELDQYIRNMAETNDRNRRKGEALIRGIEGSYKNGDIKVSASRSVRSKYTI